MFNKLISEALAPLYNGRTHHLGFFNLDIKIHRDTAKPVIMEISNGMRGLYRPVDDAKEPTIPTRLWQWLASIAPTYFCTRFDPDTDPAHWQAYNSYYDLEFMRSIPGNGLGTIQYLFSALTKGSFAPPSVRAELGILVNHDLAGQEFSATMLQDYPELLFLNGIGAMNKIIGNKVTTWQALQASGLSEFSPRQLVISKAMALATPDYFWEVLQDLPGEQFIIKPALARNGIGIIPFTRNTAADLLSRMAKACVHYSDIELPRLNAKDPFYYEDALRYWSRADVQELIIQEFIPGQAYRSGEQSFEPTIRLAVGVELAAEKASPITTTFLGGYYYLPPRPLGDGTWAEQYISNQYRGTHGVAHWHRRLSLEDTKLLQEFLAQRFTRLYVQLLLADAEQYRELKAN